jgi:hypothetical protein
MARPCKVSGDSTPGIVLFVVAIGFVAAAARAAEELVVHVSPVGNDVWTGSLATANADRSDGPVATLERARDVLRGRRAAPGGASLPSRMILADGCYRLARLFMLGPDDAGLWVADIPAAAITMPAAGRWRFEQLFVDGSRAVRAREPDAGMFAIVASTEEPLAAPDVKAPQPEAKPEADHTSGNRIENCTIRHGGCTFPAAVGIWIGQSSDNAVIHNEIFDLLYTGISAGWTWGYGLSRAQRNRIEANRIHQIGQGLLCDMGGIYTLGNAEGTVVRGNVIHGVEGRTYGGWGLYADEGTTGIVFEHNLVYDTTSGGFHQHYGRDNVVRHNVFVNARDWQVQASRPEDHHSFTFERNIIAWRSGQAIKGPWDKLQAVTGSNCWWNSAGEPVTFLGKPLTEWQSAGHEQGSIVAFPGFVDPDRHDYRLKPEAPTLPLGFIPHDWGTAGVSPVPKNSPSAIP